MSTVRKDYVDRNGKAQEMIKRTVRLTDDENMQLNELLSFTGMTLRDLVASLVSNEHKKIK